MATFAEILQVVNVEDQQSQYRELKNQQWDRAGRILSGDEISALAKRIRALPNEYMSLLFAHYYFKFSPQETTEIFGVEEFEGKLRYTCRLLSVIMGWGEAIEEDCLKEAVELAIMEYTAVDENVMVVPKYSRSFRKKLKAIKDAQTPTNIVMLVMQRAAVIILVAAISFSTALVANADLREAFFNWLIETFPEFSIFHREGEGEKNPYDISHEDIEIGYITEGYELDYYDDFRNKILYHYSKQANGIIIAVSNNDPLYADTENITINEIMLKEEQAYWWERNGRTYLVWTQNGFSCNLSGEIPVEEAIRIAESIKIKE